VSPTIVILRINGGMAHAAYKVYAASQEAAMVCARLHLMAKTGCQVI
jgi:hypothetical protein